MIRLRRFIPFARRGFRRFFLDGAVEPIPLIHSVKGYNGIKAARDLKAALDVSLVGLPQGMAFAAMAGLDPIYGIMAATVGTFVAPFFTKCSLTVSGPSNATSFMLASFFLAHPDIPIEQKAVFVPLIVFFAGCFCVAGGLFKITELLQYVSRSVLVGYITGAATLIIASQAYDVLGIQRNGGSTFFSMCSGLVSGVGEASWQALLLGCLSLVLFLFLKKYFRALPTFAVVMAVMSGLNYALSMEWTGGLFSDVAMLRQFTMQDLVFRAPDLFGSDIFSQIFLLFPIVFGVAFLSTLEQTVMSKTISARTGESLNLNQDTYAVGLANIASSFTTSLPCSASLTRSMLNYTAGAATRFSGVFCGLICLGITFLLAAYPIISYIPRSVLAALVLANAISLYDRRSLRICFRSTPGDTAVFCVTCVSALLLPLHTAIFIGVGTSIMIFLHKAAKPELVEYTVDDAGELREAMRREERVPQISIVHVEGDLFFGAAELFRSQVQRIAEDPSLAAIILRLKNARNLDATSVWALEDLIRSTREHGRHLIISGMSKEVYRILRRSGVLRTLQEGCRADERNFFLYTPQNANISTRKALLRAQQLLGTNKADISIFFNPAKKQTPS